MVPLVFLVYRRGKSQKDKALAEHQPARTHAKVSLRSKQHSAVLLDHKEEPSIVKSTDETS